MTRLDEKHLIVMAERRGLFGDTSPKKAKAKTPPKNARIEKEKTPQKVVRSFKTTDISDLVRFPWSSIFCIVYCNETPLYRLIVLPHQRMLRDDEVMSDINQRPKTRLCGTTCICAVEFVSIKAL